MKFITFVYEDPDENLVLNLDRINYCQISSSMIRISFGGQDLTILKGNYSLEEHRIDFTMNSISINSERYDKLKEILINVGLRGE